MRRHAYRMGLGLLALSLAACGGAPPSATPAAAPSPRSAPTVAPTPGTLWGDPMADQTPIAADGGAGVQVVGGPTPPPDGAAVTGGDPAPTASASPAASPAPGASAAPGTPPKWVPFVSSGREAGGLGVYVYDRTSGTVLALPGVNSAADEVDPYLSANGEWLAYASNLTGNYDIYLFNTTTQMINQLGTLNTDANERHPAVSNDGGTIAYLNDSTPTTPIRIFEARLHQTMSPGAIARLNVAVYDPAISGDGRVVAFSARTTDNASQVYAYEITTSTMIDLGFLNGAKDEFDPALNLDGTKLAFSSNRDGSNDLYVADLSAKTVSALTRANSSASETNPRFMGTDEVLFQTDRAGKLQLKILNTPQDKLDDLPIEGLIDPDTYMAPVPSAGSGSGGSLFDGAFGGTFGRRSGGIF